MELRMQKEQIVDDANEPWPELEQDYKGVAQEMATWCPYKIRDQACASRPVHYWGSQTSTPRRESVDFERGSTKGVLRGLTAHGGNTAHNCSV